MTKLMLVVLMSIITVMVGFEVYGARNDDNWTNMARTFITLAIGLVGVVLIIFMFSKIGGGKGGGV